MFLLLMVVSLGAARQITDDPRSVQLPDCSGDMGDLYKDFVEVAKLRTVLDRMQQLEAAGDSDFLELLGFFQGPKFQAITSWMWADPGFVDLYKWLRTCGVDMDAIFAWISDELGMNFTPPKQQRAAAASPRSIMSVWDQLVAIIPYPDLVSWFLEMYVTNQAMVDFVSKLQESEPVKDRLNASPEYQNYRCWLIGEGVDLVKLETNGCTFLGWQDCETQPCGPYPTQAPTTATTTTTTSTTTITTTTTTTTSTMTTTDTAITTHPTNTIGATTTTMPTTPTLSTTGAEKVMKLR